MKLNKIKKELLNILIVIITGLIINGIIVYPIKSKIKNIKIEKEQVINNNKQKVKLEEINDSISDDQLEEADIVLNIEKEFSKFINVLYVNKFTEWDENNNEYTKIELKVSGSVDQLFKINDEIKKIKGNNSIENMQINKKTNNNVETKERIKVNIIDCVMTFRVG
ncbi:hypothetical protein [Romboutsia sp.]|uniref:hypothetical protein n=1 Tax=Romboutsia sp. TaxID=1965302 RepID=UPI002C24D18E|nr:hypothetical protein [Romboutsia sp.]HSQ88771.1 hypothetical protein [Romboutsia sp.]